MSSTVFDKYSMYYDLIYRDKDYEAEVSYIKDKLKDNNIITGRLLELGSGTGRHAALLVNEGFTVHGVELSNEMLALSQNINGFTCIQGDICEARLNQKFDAVLALFHVVSYQISNKAVSSVFATAAEHLNEGGIFIFDFWYSPAVCNLRPQVRVKNYCDKENEFIRIAEPIVYANENRVDVNYTIIDYNNRGKFHETHSMRHFSLPEIDFLAEINGFERVNAEEFISCLPPSDSSWGVCVTLRKV